MEKTYEVPNGIISVGTALVPSTMKSRRDSTSAKVFGEDWRFFFLSSLSTFQQTWTSKGKCDESGLPRAHDADHVREVQRARHVRGDPGRFVSVCFKTHSGHRNGLLRRCVAQSSHLRGVAEPLNLFVETYGIEISLLPCCSTNPALGPGASCLQGVGFLFYAHAQSRQHMNRERDKT